MTTNPSHSKARTGEWRTIADAHHGVTVETKIDDIRGERNFAQLRRSGNLWFLSDGSMYVYYTPTHWSPI